MSDKFREYVTGVAFNLSLSKNMCEALAYFRYDAPKDDARGFTVIGELPTTATWQSLERRGLIGRTWRPTAQGGTWTPLRITPAGRHTFELLVLAGLCERREVASEAA